MDDYSSALIMEMEQLAQLEPHPNIVGLIRVCSVSSKSCSCTYIFIRVHQWRSYTWDWNRDWVWTLASNFKLILILNTYI